MDYKENKKLIDDALKDDAETKKRKRRKYITIILCAIPAVLIIWMVVAYVAIPYNDKLSVIEQHSDIRFNSYYYQRDKDSYSCIIGPDTIETSSGEQITYYIVPTSTAPWSSNIWSGESLLSHAENDISAAGFNVIDDIETTMPFLHEQKIEKILKDNTWKHEPMTIDYGYTKTTDEFTMYVLFTYDNKDIPYIYYFETPA